LITTEEKLNIDKIEELLNNKNWEIRLKVAEGGLALGKLMYDDNHKVRQMVARKAKPENIKILGVLMYDKEAAVRLEVAQKGFGLNVLSTDEDWIVRREVAKQGYESLTMVKDTDERVRNEALKHLTLLNGWK